MNYELISRADGLWIVYTDGCEAGPFASERLAREWAGAVKEMQANEK